MKKLTSILLAIIMTFSGLFVMPMSVNAAESASNTENTCVPLYQANVIANGYNNDGEGHYKLFKSLQDPLYYELTDYMLEDDVLCWTSNFWNAAFNSEFQKNPSYFYEVMLMGFLKYDQNQINTSGVWNSKEMALSTTIYNTIANNYIDKFENPSYKDLVKQVNELSNDEVKNILSNIDDIKITQQALGTLSKGCSYATEFIKAVADYQALLDAKSERIELLKLAKSKVTDNEYFTKAVDDIIDKMEQTPIEYISGQMLDKIWDDFLNSAWDLIIKGSPIATVLKAIDIEKMTLDVLFNTSETASDNFKLLVLYIVDTYFSSALEQAYDNYKSSGTVSNAATLIQCYRAYIEYQVYGLDYTKTFVNNIVDSGTIHHIIEQIFFQESIESAAELTKHCDNQIINREKLLELLDKSADIYYSSTGLDELVDAIESTEEVNVPVTGISFKQSEITLNSTEDICLIYADVYPENASNKKVTYTSSDPSILSVPSDGGFATQNGEGTVTITATTEDGGFTATQKVNVNYKPVLATTDNGKCGDSVYWRLYSDGTLYISGTGKMKNYNSHSPWYNYEIKSVIIGYGVTSIGNYAFEDCTSLASVTIPDSVTSIGNYAFNYCASLASVTIGNSVTSIGNSAFYYCRSLASVTIGNSVTSIGDWAFYNCTSLASVTNPDSVTSIGNCAFLGCTSLASVIIPDSVTSIGDCAFSGCTSLASVTIPDSVTSIGNGAFEDCTSLESVTIGNSVTSIGDDAFNDCNNLKKVYIDNITSWYNISFDNCYSNPLNNYAELYLNGKLVIDLKIPDSVTSIGNYAFLGCTSLESVTIGNSVISIGSSAFKFCYNLSNITIPDSVTSIGDHAFLNCRSLESVTIPDSVTSIGNYAFYYCTSLASVTIPDSVTSIGDWEFYNCTSLESVTIGNSVISIGSSAFKFCYNLSNITIPDSVTSIGNYAFEDCTSLTSVTIPDSVTGIGNMAFEDCTSLASVTIPDSVTSIGNSAFSACTSLKDVYYSGSEEEWNKISIGSDNSGLKKATIHFNSEGPLPAETIVDENTGISVTTNSVAEFNVENLTDSDSAKNVNSLLDKSEKLADLYDISLTKDGISVQPDEPTTVKIPTDNENAKVYRIEDNGTKTDMNAVYDNGYMVFTTDHFSLYALVIPNDNVIGDANGDGEVDIQDVTCIQMYVAKLGADTVDASVCDLDGDGKVGISDASYLQMKLAKLI
ncbi:leucine-rich repeat protein [bacterium]|nr:leucine-rich repeat protein [bacterium]